MLIARLKREQLKVCNGYTFENSSMKEGDSS